jgi:hypothetical protein
MGMSQRVAERAITLVREGANTDAAVEDLLGMVLGNRVAVVMAKQRLEGGDAEPPDAQGAIKLLDLALDRGVWAF